MRNKALGAIIVTLTCLIVAGNRLAVSSSFDGSKHCDCSDLKGLEFDLSNAVYLHRSFNTKIPALQKMDHGSAQGEYKRFAENLGQRIKAPPGYTGPKSVDYTPRGDNVVDDAGYTNEQLCEPSSNSKQDLADANRGAICEVDAAAVRAHEEVHRKMCMAIGYRAYRDMHAADRAREETEAYQSQTEMLRAGINSLSCVNKSSSQPQHSALSLALGNPPLTQQMVDEVNDFLNWVLEITLTSAQRQQVQDSLVASWRKGDRSEIEGTQEILNTAQAVKTRPQAEQNGMRFALRSVLLEQFRRDRNDATSQMLLGAYHVAHPNGP